MLNHTKIWKAEYAKSSRSKCKACQHWIQMETLRIGKTVQATRFDGIMTRWNHASCILKKGSRIKSIDDVEGFESLRWDDQQKIRKYIDDAAAKASTPIVLKCGVEVSQTSLATCRCCKQKIAKGEVRISTKPEVQKSKVVVWHHAKCYMDMSPTSEVHKFSGWDNISDSDRETLLALVEKNPTVSTDTKIEQEEPLQESEWKGGAKRKRSVQNNLKSEITRTGGISSPKNEIASGSRVKNIESELEIQSKALWALKDDLRTHVAISKLREMLQVNDQDSSGSELDLRQNCADGMLFGALAKCSLCSGFLSYSSGMYRCCGYISEWSKCSYSTTEPQRVKGIWKIPEDTSNEYLLKWFKSQKAEKLEKVYPRAVESPKTEHIRNLKVAIVGLSNESVDEWKNKIVKLGGKFHPTINKVTSCLVVFGALSDHAVDIRNARRRNVPVVREAYLADCITTQRKLPFDLYRVKPMEERRRSRVQKELLFDSCKVEPVENKGFLSTVMVKGQSEVSWFSDLQHWGHILEDGKSICNTTLNMSDLSTGINSYYILQIIEDDKSSACVVFRKWGRVGNEEVGGTKSEDMRKSNAIQEFKRLFMETTGNSWESWEKKKKFQKQPGRYFPLDIDYGVRLEPKKKKHRNFRSKLTPQLVKLMKMLFNVETYRLKEFDLLYVETYRAAMLELKIDLSKMLLGKLSKSNIQKGFEALTQIQNLLSSTNHPPSIKENLLVDASNMFFTVIPSIHPYVIKDEDDLTSKVKMLEALQDIEIASKLVGFEADNHESIDEKYEKLHCHITPLPHDSKDFKLIEKYIKTTHAPTRKEWALELEEVFCLEREGELAKYAPYRAKLKNKMLLWHGSRLTNFVGILSQGLRIAPPEAPRNGYMFGKGIYFADLVSKSALYCCTDPTNPVGLMLLSEVALGNVYELTNSEYMDEPPEGKHSTKGLGKRVPLMSEHVKWRDDVVVPCGKPVASRVKDTELMYNEYIVYDKSQVKMQYLLTVRFHHRRK